MLLGLFVSMVLCVVDNWCNGELLSISCPFCVQWHRSGNLILALAGRDMLATQQSAKVTIRAFGHSLAEQCLHGKVVMMGSRGSSLTGPGRESTHLHPSVPSLLHSDCSVKTPAEENFPNCHFFFKAVSRSFEVQLAFALHSWMLSY